MIWWMRNMIKVDCHSRNTLHCHSRVGGNLSPHQHSARTEMVPRLGGDDTIGRRDDTNGRGDDTIERGDDILGRGDGGFGCLKYIMVKKIKFLLALVIFQSSVCFAVSLFDDASYQSLITDQKAYHQGDLLTVLVMETSNAETNTQLGSNKGIKSALSAGYDDTEHEVSLGLKGEGKSSAKTGRNGKIKAAITVSVKHVLDNQKYLIQGKQLIQINGEMQTIILSGIVRAQDISPQNTLLSTRLANAHITYTGLGEVSNATRKNYLYQALSWLGLV